MRNMLRKQRPPRLFNRAQYGAWLELKQPYMDKSDEEEAGDTIFFGGSGAHHDDEAICRHHSRVKATLLREIDFISAFRIAKCDVVQQARHIVDLVLAIDLRILWEIL